MYSVDTIKRNGVGAHGIRDSVAVKHLQSGADLRVIDTNIQIVGELHYINGK